jgi:hypothetical protein
MFELANVQPFLIGFFVLAGAATALSVAALVLVVADLRRGHAVTPVVPFVGRSRPVASDRAA